MKKALNLILTLTLIASSFSFIEDEKKVVCGEWKAYIFSRQTSRKIGVDTLQVKRNGRFILKKYSTESLPGVYMGRWKIDNDSLLLIADSGGMLQFDEKGRPVTEKLKNKLEVKLSIIIHSRNEMYLNLDNCNFARFKQN